MCGILGMIGNSVTKKMLNKSLEIIKNRGKDGYGVFDGKKTVYNSMDFDDSKFFIAHTLHSIVGNKILQPFGKKNIFVTNCEIYNWKEIDEFDSLNDSDFLFNLIEKKGVLDAISMLDGVYAFAYLSGDTITLARDIIGEKPLFYYQNESFMFASEKKALELVVQDSNKIIELNPRIILEYNFKKNTLKEIPRSFFSTEPIIKDSKEIIISEVSRLLISSIKKRIPNQKFGILFSGGIDSTIIAYICKNITSDFVCYTSAFEDGNFSKSSDLEFSQEIAKKYGFKLKVKKLDLAQVKERLKIILPLIESSNVVKAEVALTIFAACEAAREDGIKVIFSGLGSEEIFAGYERHKLSSDINKECIYGLLKLYERDTYRDDCVTMFNEIEVRNPFLDLDLIKYCLRIPAEHKLSDIQNKIILRTVSERLGLDIKYSQRKKVAAQYGSKFDKAITKLSKNMKKAEFLKEYYKPLNNKLGVLWSGGKDSCFAAFTIKQMNYEIACLISLKSNNQDSYMFHTPNIDLVDLQAKAMGVPIIIETTNGEKEIELEDLKNAIIKAKKLYEIDGIVTGALYSNYQRERIENICDSLGLKIFCPLWHIDQELEFRSILKNNFNVILSSIAADGLNKSWLGRKITTLDIDSLVKINKKNGINIAFEGGEAETFITDCPMFTKKIEIIKSNIDMENEYTGRFIIEKAELKEK